MRHISIDIETYSDIDIKGAGAYKYAQSPAFELLLFAYKIDDEPTVVIDLFETGGLPVFIIPNLSTSYIGVMVARTSMSQPLQLEPS